MTGWTPSPEVVDFYSSKTIELRTSDEPQWVEARRLLADQEMAPEDAVLAEWHDEGEGLDQGIVVTRDTHLFRFNVLYFGEAARAYEGGTGRIDKWREVAPHELRSGPDGTPGVEAMAAIIARVIFEREAAG